VRRTTALLFLLLIAPAHAQTFAADAALDPRLIVNVYVTALAFMAPRTLEPVPVGQLTIWGLNGLTALDPNLAAEWHNNKVQLLDSTRLLTEQQAPAANDVQAWATLAAEFAAIAAGSSMPVRRAGNQGVVQSFFDELFNHLDPYSRYVGPTEANEDRELRAGRAGAGLQLFQRGAAIVVFSAVSDGPGARAGIRPGDMILAVDGQAAQGKDARRVANWIDGPEQTSVTVTWRGHDGRQHTADMQRAMVPPETVYSERIENMLVIQVTAFNRSTATHLTDAIQEGLAATRRPDGIVLDLRGNPGGILRQAVEAAGTLLPDGVVVITAGRDPEATRIWRSTGSDLAEYVPVVVLVDGRTASAAEILAAALADRGRAVVVGSSTLGKGLVQTIAPLPDGGELFVTWSRVLAPRGWPIQGLGVLPQLCTSLGQDSLSLQLATLSQGRDAMAPAIATQRTARAPLSSPQILAIRDACPAAGGRDTDMDAARILIRDPGAYASALLPPIREDSQTVGASSQKMDHGTAP
jgi:carboxyl-terminal processing protease